MFGIIATVVVAVIMVVAIARIVLVFVRPDRKSISETLRGNDEKYE